MTEPRIPSSWQEITETGIDITKLPDFPSGFRRTVYRVDARVMDGQLKAARPR